MSEIDSTPDVTGPNADEQDFLERILGLLPFEGTAAQLQLLGELWREASGATSVRIVIADVNGGEAEAETRGVEILNERGDKLGGVFLTGASEGGPGEEFLTRLTQVLLMQRAEFQKRLWEAKLDSLGEFAAGAGHEINNPVATITGRVQLLLAGEANPERRRALETIAGQALRIRDMIGDVMLFARPPLPVRERIELAIFLPEVAEKFRAQGKSAGCALIVNVEEGLELWGDRIQVAIAVGALIRNSIEASPEGGDIRIEGRKLSLGGKERILISVLDQGKGVNDVERAHLFDPFFSGRQAGRGLGFGLSKAWRIVTLHGGEIEVSPRVEGGLRFDLIWKGSDENSVG